MRGARIVVALDFPDARTALNLAARLDPTLCRVKVGKELFTSAGPDVVRKLGKLGFGVFLDLKFHDIPSTAAAACRASAALGLWMVNVHALGGRAMLRAARKALEGSGVKLVAVTLLTSLERGDLEELGISGAPADAAQRLSRLARDCGLDGVVCSGQEARRLRQDFGPEFCLVTPGIRPAGAERQDQKRVMTPREAIAAGADYLVIGRPVTASPDPAQALKNIYGEIGEFA